MSQHDVLLARCTFCSKPDTAVAKLIAGAGVYICNECVGLCNDILAEYPATTSPPRLHPWETMTDEQVLEHIPRIVATAAAVEADLRRWVEQLRTRSITWARIGGALGMTRQSAWERFSNED